MRILALLAVSVGLFAQAPMSSTIATGGTSGGLIDLSSGVTDFLPVQNICTDTNRSSSTFLRGDCTWDTVAVLPAGSDTEVQFNDGGATGAESTFTFNKATGILSIPGGITSTGSSSGSILLEGLTSGAAAIVVNDVAGTATAYILPTTSSQGKIWVDSGTATCPTLAAGLPAACHQLAASDSFLMMNTSLIYGGNDWSVPFLGASGLVTEDNNNFYYDVMNARLTVGNFQLLDNQVIEEMNTLQICVRSFACPSYVDITSYISPNGSGLYNQTLLGIQSTEDAVNGYFDSDVIFKTDQGSKFSIGAEDDGMGMGNPRFYVWDQTRSMGIFHIDSAASPSFVIDTGVNFLATGYAFAKVMSGYGTTPSVSGCGTIGTGSTNNAGFITTATGACASVLTFSNGGITGWSCAINNSTTPANPFQQTASSTTTATFTGVSASNDVIRYACIAY